MITVISFVATILLWMANITMSGTGSKSLDRVLLIAFIAAIAILIISVFLIPIEEEKETRNKCQCECREVEQ